MKNFITSFLVAISIISCSGIAANNGGKIDKKHKYGEKILVLEINSVIY